MGSRSLASDDRSTRPRVDQGDRGDAPDGALVGFARVMSDGSNMAWGGDVFVLAEHRGRGLGTELVREAVSYPDHRDCNWYLNTRDAHNMYAKLGFEPADPDRTMVRRRPN